MEGSSNISKLSDQKLEEHMSKAADGMIAPGRTELAVGWAVYYTILSEEREERHYEKIKKQGNNRRKRVFTYELPNY